MFKIESYITPILLSYVDKYIKNFRLEDSTVSLWGGDACFHNLDLRLEVLEQELHLPISFVSGHIRELLIHVPWTKLASEPITITINTIECILKLRGSDSSSSSSSSGKTKDKFKTQSHDLETPPGYLTSLIHKIVGNIRIYCNNLILKYVEEDIVLSMNIKHFEFESANELWEPSFSDPGFDEVKIRKIICINDLTVCLDKRNAAGKIEVYQEPMLYKCSMTMHLLRTYHSASASRSSTTRLDIYCNSLEFGISEQQLPMFIRLILLCYALKKKKKEQDHEPNIQNSSPNEVKDNENNDTWTGWAWSYVSSVLSEAANEESLDQHDTEMGHILHIGFYIDKASIIFKVTDASRERNYYQHKKLRYMPVLALELQGIYTETITHGSKWFNFTFGISEILLSPLGHCSCSVMETPEGCKPIPYLRIGSQSSYYKFNSLFDADALENKGAKRFYNNCWDYHLINLTESVLLERTPSFAVDYIHEMAIPDDLTSDKLAEISSNLEYSNLPERDYSRIFIAPLKLRVSSGFHHRISSMIMAAINYEYVPYYVPSSDPSYQDLLPPSEEDFDALNEFIPLATIKVTFFAPVIEFETADHPHFVPKKGKLYRKHKKISSHAQITVAQATQQDNENVKLVVEVQCLDLLYISPFYVNRLVHTTCQLPDPPKSFFDACFKKFEFKIFGLTSRLVFNSNCQTTLLLPFNASFVTREILKPQYWTDPDVTHFDLLVESENITLNGTKAKFLLINDMITALFQLSGENNNLQTSSIMADAFSDAGLPYMELYIEGIRFKKVSTHTTISLDMSLNSVKAFIFESFDQEGSKVTKITKKYLNRNIQQILFISGPEPKQSTTDQNSSEIGSLFSATIQFPINPDNQVHPTILTYNIQEIRICVDPLVFKWFLYKPRYFRTCSFTNFSDTPYKVKSAESSIFGESTKKSSMHLESVHSSSDRDKSSVVSKKSKILKEEPIDVQEKFYNFLRDWFNVWKSMIVSGEISQCIIYFPMVSLSAVGSQGIQQAVDAAIKKKHPPDIMIIRLPSLVTYCTQRQSLKKYITHLPVNLPETIWAADRSCFPWTLAINDLSCYTIQNGLKMDCLKPCSLNATIGLSTKSSSSDINVPESDAPSSKEDISSFGVYIHVDMTPVLISICEGQVYLLASILYGLIEVFSSFFPSEKPKHHRDYHTTILESIDSKSESITIPENSMDQQSSSHANLNETELESKLTAWLQWTITKFTIELNSMTKESKKSKPKLKLVIDTEDIVSSIDLRNIYLKVKSKVGSISVEHFKLVNDVWQPGPYLGLVMRHRDDFLSEERHEDNAFINLTITRASCRHTHTLWGTLHRKKDLKLPSGSSSSTPTRFITEIVVSIKPTDLILSFKTLKNFNLVLEPLFAIKMPERKGNSFQGASYITNQYLPLAYLECHDIRVIVPATLLKKKSDMKLGHNVYMLQFSKISLCPRAVNPICRSPYRPDLYLHAARSRILNIPGSDMEDRQYQLDIIGTSLNTGSWKDVELILNMPSGIFTSLHGTSENPAVEWNNLEKVCINSNPSTHLWPVVEKIDLSIIAAPAMVYKDVLVCCNSVEINIVSDIAISICLSQMKLALFLFGEFSEFLQPVKTSKRKINFPYAKFADSVDESDMEAHKDSGVDSSEFKSVGSSLKHDIYRVDSEKYSTLLKSSSSNIDNIHPLEFLLTGGKISISIFKIGSDFPIYSKNIDDQGDERRPVEKIKKSIKNVKESINKMGGVAPLILKPITKMKSLKKKLQPVPLSSNDPTCNEEFDRRFIPLCFIFLAQPNMYMLDEKNTRKLHLSLFNLSLKISGAKYPPTLSVPTDKDYQISLLETLAGTPHPDTGIPPAFLTAKMTTKSINNTKLDIDFSRPTRILCSQDICYDLLGIHQEVRDFLQAESFPSSEKTSISPPTFIPENSESYVKFQAIKSYIFNINNVNINSDQLVLVWEANTDYKLRFTIGKIKNNFSLSNRPDKLLNFMKLECISLLYESSFISQLVLNPWTVAVDLTLFWESWQSLGEDPQTQIIAESESLMLAICPERLEVLNIFVDDLMRFVRDIRSCIKVPDSTPERIHCVMPKQDSEQYYKDDLRAGAFQFVDSTTDNVDEMPLPYQVMFWNKNIAAMAWRYPQPRSLTKVRVFPVPLKVAIQGEYEIEISCRLEYWSECHTSFIPYTQFILPEDEILLLKLPKRKPHQPFACIWRVELTISKSNIEDADIFSVFSPHALAACMRIDSYFNRCLVSNFSMTCSISRLHAAFYTKYDKERYNILPSFLKGYNTDLLFPSRQCFLEIILDNSKIHSSSWNLDTFLIDMTTTIQVLVLEYAFLTMQPIIECSGLKFKTSISNRCDCSFVSKTVSVYFSPSIAHTLAVSTQLWNLNQISSLANESNRNLNFCILARYIICNDTNIALKFGQNNTDEEIMLMPKYFNLYCWRTQKQKQNLRISLEGKEWLWSEPFSLKVGTQVIEISEKKKLTLNLTVVELSATQYQVIFSGQLVIANMLLEHFELKIVRENVTDNRKIVNQVVAGNSMTTSMVINYDKAYFLRLRFYGLDTSWSGDIPLMEHSKSSQPWLVKVPLMERGQFLSIWCRVVVQNFTNGKKILAMLWPLFSIKSNLPISTKAHIETPTLNYHGEITVKSHGELQQLYCPGTIDHSHQLTFQLENVAPSPNPYVPLNYSLIDHESFFKRMDKVDVNDVLNYLKSRNENKWPYFGEELSNVEWVVGEQPETHVQVKYHNSCEYSSSLMVELLPWCILANICGCRIGISMEGEEVCVLQHNGIVTPPKIEGNFHFLVYINDEKYISDPLQFAKPVTWSQNFYMPTILGIIPQDGTISCNVKCREYICKLSILSCIVNDIRLIKVASTHVICNNTGFEIYVMCIVCPSRDVFVIPDHKKCNFLTVPPDTHEKNQGISIVQWYNLEEDEQNMAAEHALYVIVSLNPNSEWSKPIRVDETFERKTISLMTEVEPVPLAITLYQYKGQNFIGVHHDTKPQIYIENNSGVTLYCAQPKEGENSEVMQEVEHFEWFCEIKDGSSNYYSMLSFLDKYPDIPTHRIQENLMFSKDPYESVKGSVWSSEVNLADDCEQYVKIPSHGDVKIIVKNSSCLTYIKVESVSRVEVNAKDIRARLLEFEESTKASSSSAIKEKPQIVHSVSAEAIKPYEQDLSEINHEALSMEHVMDNRGAEVHLEKVSRRKSETNLMYSKRTKKTPFCSTIPMMYDWEILDVKVLINNFTFTLLSDININTADIDEITSLICDNIAISATQSECMKMDLYIQDIQIDNQLYSKSNFDFPVILLMQIPLTSEKIFSLDVVIDDILPTIRASSAMKLSLTIDTWVDPRNYKVSGLQELTFDLKPFSCYLEDTYFLLLSEYLNIFIPINLITLFELPIQKTSLESSFFIHIPDIVLWQSSIQAYPLTIRHMKIRPISVMLSVHSSIKIYLALDQSPLFFTEFERRRVFTNAYRLGHTLTMHYLSGAIFRAGWMVSSLEILGSPAGLARAMGSGLKDFVSLPFRGLLQGPVEFLYGVTHGSASLMRHITAGTLQSFTKMASSVARNLDYLTLDEEHVRRAEEQRRQRPSGVTEGLMQGLSGLGISILGAIGGIAHHPLQSVISEGGSPRSLATGLGLGLVGIITKPLSGAAELLALTGQGLLQGAGWNNMPEQRNQPILRNMFSSNSSILKYEWKMNTVMENSLKFLHMTDATSVSSNFQYAALALIITNKSLMIVNADEDTVQNSIILSELEPLKTNSDPTMLSLELIPTQPTVMKVEDDVIVEMDPASRARVADYVKNTVGLLQVAGGSKGPSEMSISPLSSPGGRSDNDEISKKVLTFYVNPQDRNYFLCLLAMAKHENLNSCDNYPVLSNDT